jgi:hypothetical protein
MSHCYLIGSLYYTILHCIVLYCTLLDCSLPVRFVGVITRSDWNGGLARSDPSLLEYGTYVARVLIIVRVPGSLS